VPETEESGGDTLAKFVVKEIYETYEEHGSDIEQVEEAQRVTDMALEDLAAVSRGLRAWRHILFCLL
jgi:hypothetical protein